MGSTNDQPTQEDKQTSVAKKWKALATSEEAVKWASEKLNRILENTHAMALLGAKSDAHQRCTWRDEANNAAIELHRRMNDLIEVVEMCREVDVKRRAVEEWAEQHLRGEDQEADSDLPH